MGKIKHNLHNVSYTDYVIVCWKNNDKYVATTENIDEFEKAEEIYEKLCKDFAHVELLELHTTRTVLKSK